MFSGIMLIYVNILFFLARLKLPHFRTYYSTATHTCSNKFKSVYLVSVIAPQLDVST